MVNSSVSNSADVVSYASSFSSGEAGVVIVNKGTSSQIVSVKLKDFVTGSRYYYYKFTGGKDNGEFSRKVYINGRGPDSVAGGPHDYLTLEAKSSKIKGGIKVSAPPMSVIYLVAENKKQSNLKK